MDTEITCVYVQEGSRGSPIPVLSIVDRAEIYVSCHNLLAVRRARTQITLLSARADKWSVPYNFFDNRQTVEQLSRLQIIIQEEILMAKRTTRQSEFERPEWKGFLNYALNEQQLADADSQKLTSSALWEAINNLMLVGYRLTLSYSAPMKAYTATLQAGKEQGVAAGWALSARDEKAEGALKLLLYKHFTALEGDWTPLLDTPKRVQRG